MARVAVSIAACAAGLAQPVCAGQDDAFLRQHQKELAQYDSTGLSIAFTDERRAFQPGEAIPVRLTFDLQARDDLSPGNYEHCDGLGVADAVLDRTEGAVDRDADLWRNGAVKPSTCGIFGGRMGGLITAEGITISPPVKFVVYLNQTIRFDRPGTYRFYIRSSHRIADDRHYIPPLISNVLTLEIIPRDPAWEARTLAEALAVIDAPKEDFPQTVPHEVRYRAFEKRDHAERVISYLGTDDAADALVRRFDSRTRSVTYDPRIGFRANHWLRGLYGSPNRARVIDRMTEELNRADRFISPQFIEHLAVLELTRRDKARPIARSRYEARVRALTARRQKVLARAGR